MSDNGVSYYELLKHPKWQRKRLEIMQAADFKCERCSADDVTLNVHHTYYEKGKAPWEYPNTSLHCVCENCHKNVQDRYNLLQSQIRRLTLVEVEMVLGYALAIETESSFDVVIDVFTMAIAVGVGCRFRVSGQEVIDACEEGKIDGHKLLKLYSAKHP